MLTFLPCLLLRTIPRSFNGSAAPQPPGPPFLRSDTPFSPHHARVTAPACCISLQERQPCCQLQQQLAVVGSRGERFGGTTEAEEMAPSRACARCCVELRSVHSSTGAVATATMGCGGGCAAVMIHQQKRAAVSRMLTRRTCSWATWRCRASVTALRWRSVSRRSSSRSWCA